MPSKQYESYSLSVVTQSSSVAISSLVGTGVAVYDDSNICYYYKDRQLNAVDFIPMMEIDKEQNKLDKAFKIGVKRAPKLTPAQQKEYDAKKKVLADKRQTTQLWSLPSEAPVAMIKAGELLILGMNDSVVAINAVSKKKVWEAPVQGGAVGLTATEKGLYVSTDNGNIYGFPSSSKGKTRELKLVVGVSQKTDTPVKIKSGMARAPKPAKNKSTAKAPKPVRKKSTAKAPKPIAHWSFEEASGAMVTDSVKGISGTCEPTVRLGIEGVKGKAVEFPGKSSHIVLGDKNSLLFGENDFSVSFWVKTSGWTKDAAIISNKDWKSGRRTGWVVSGYRSGANGLTWNFTPHGSRRSDLRISDVAVSDDQWHHVCATHERGGKATMYLDGEIIGETGIDDNAGSIDSGLLTVLGADGNKNYSFSGSVDELMLFDRAITAEEALKLSEL